MVTPMFFVTGIASIVLVDVTDKFGRKKPVIASVFGTLITLYLCLSIPNFAIRTLYFTMMGVCTLRVTSSLCFSAELCESRHIPITSSFACTFDALSTTLVYFTFFISRNWLPASLFVTGLYTLAGLALFLLPESPKWLISQGRTKEAIDVFNRIAWINGSEKRIPEDAVFEEDILQGPDGP
jgi:MFS family permease